MGMTGTRRRNSIHSDVLGWCVDLPGWQQDGLRRIVESGALEANDIDELTALCRHANGLAEDSVPELKPLRAEHVPAGQGNGQKVTLKSVSDLENVNALGEKQELVFAATGLTIIFGYNGSGKTGYGRLLRRSCRARSKGEPILPNVFASSPSAPASAVITYAIDDLGQPPEPWIDNHRQIDALGSVSFFDSECAAVHVRKPNDVAFTPFGLDLLPQLGTACMAVQKKLDAEKKRLEATYPKFLSSAYATGTTSVGSLLKSLAHNTSIEEVEALAALSADELQRMKDLPAQLASDPQKIAKDLRARAQRITIHKDKLRAAFAELSPESMQRLKLLAEEAGRKKKTADAAAKAIFASDPLPKIGEDIWRELWEAARRYSAVAIPYKGFPIVDDDDAVCVLCQQILDVDAKNRLRRFEAFVYDDTAKQAEVAATALNTAVEKVRSLGLKDEGLREQLKDIVSSDGEVLKKVRQSLASLLKRLRAIENAHRSGDWSFPLSDEIDDMIGGLQAIIDRLTQQASDIEKSADAEERKRLELQLQELKAREWLATVLGDVKENITRLGELKKLQNCIVSTRTNKITAKCKELAKEYVTDQLRDAFATEIKSMQQGVRRLNVELATAPGEYGSMHYRVRIVGAYDADIGSVVSEGEHRCIGLAGFLSELATEHSKSTVIFDDPVTSLDHHWRECFARRLVKEASERQVIVFTHDIVFLHDLISNAQQTGGPVELRRVQANRDRCGFVDEGLPWIAQKTLPRIDALEKRARATRRDFDDQNDDVYNRDICSVYGDLRATIERAIEEHFFRGTVIRHQDYISLNNLRKVTAMTTDHCDRLQNLFKRCCDITSAHDRSSLRSFGVPTPDDALNDLIELKALVDDVKEKQKLIS